MACICFYIITLLFYWMVETGRRLRGEVFMSLTRLYVLNSSCDCSRLLAITLNYGDIALNINISIIYTRTTLVSILYWLFLFYRERWLSFARYLYTVTFRSLFAHTNKSLFRNLVSFFGAISSPQDARLLLICCWERHQITVTYFHILHWRRQCSDRRIILVSSSVDHDWISSRLCNCLNYYILNFTLMLCNFHTQSVIEVLTYCWS